LALFITNILQDLLGSNCLTAKLGWYQLCDSYWVFVLIHGNHRTEQMRTI